MSNFFSAVNFFQFLVIKILDQDWFRILIVIYPKMLDPDPEQLILIRNTVLYIHCWSVPSTGLVVWGDLVKIINLSPMF